MINYKINKQIYSLLTKPKSYEILGEMTPREYGSYSSETKEDVILNLGYISEGRLKVMSKDLDISKYCNILEKFVEKKLETTEKIDILSPKFRNYLASKCIGHKLVKVPNLFMLKPNNDTVKRYLEDIYKYDFMYGITEIGGRLGYLDFTYGIDKMIFKTSRYDKGIDVSVRLIKSFYIITGE